MADSWARNAGSARSFFGRASGRTGTEGFFMSTMWMSVGLSTLISGTLVFVLASAVHAILLSVVVILAYTGFSLLWLLERIFLGARSFFMACPHCHAHATLPEYYCDACGAVHAKLMPNSYGSLFHRCQCGNRIPATFFLNRGRLQARCPACHENIAREHVESRRLFIPVMGGPSAGKSAFLFGAVRQLLEQDAVRLGFQAELFDKRSESVYRHIADLLQSGHPPDKTADPIPRAFNLSLRRKGRLEFLLYLYDPAGEAYQDVDKLSAHGFHAYLSGMVLVIDPFAIPAVQDLYEEDLVRKHGFLKPSSLPIEDAIDRLLLNLESNFKLSKTNRVAHPLAIVLNKVDAFDLQDVIGERAVDKAVKSWTGKLPANRESIRNTMLRQQLLDWGEKAFVSRIDARFSNVGYFSCSALGRMPDGHAIEFSAQDVMPPLVWIFKHIDRSKFGADVGKAST
jgi:hypothetical protein